MELDVHLTREGDESWGFEFVGGADFEIPLTIDKVSPGSPAQRAGLQPGDIVARLGDRLASELSLEAAQGIAREAICSLSFGICRGLYDPVLDDYEPIYEPIERADSDLRSEPTEVLDPRDLSLDDPNILDPRITDPSLWDSGYGLSRPVTETRSLTASPFVPNTKPFRPFSTEPLEVPPLDDPIILNPNFRDTFNVSCNQVVLDRKEDELVRLLPLDNKNIEAKFKLPISEKYDPEWDKKVKAMLDKCAEGGRKSTEKIEQELIGYSEKSEAVTTEVKDLKSTKQVAVQDNVTQITQAKHEVKFEKSTVEERSVKQIEQTALEVVEESIERAVSVTEDIKKEMEEELRASATRDLQEESEIKVESKTHIEESESKRERKESVFKNEFMEHTESTQETLEHITEEESILEKQKQDEKFVEERKLSIKKELVENIETGNVSRKSSAFEKKDESRIENYESTKQVMEENISAGTVKKQSTAFERDEVLPTKEESRKASQTEQRKSQHYQKEYRSSREYSNETQKMTEGKQKAYMIGLQTIPHIKGFVQSSYHFDLLLRTFFVHLTDVMVALSRFILTQPAQELETKAERVVKEKLIKEFAKQDEQFEKKETNVRHEDNRETMHLKENKKQEIDSKMVQTQQETKIVNAEMQQQRKAYNKESLEKHETKQDVQALENITHLKASNVDIHTEELEIRKRSGAEMAQRTQRKSKDLTNKMDAVITEFETKTGIEDRLEVTDQRSRRSRSRSQVEVEVMKESDPLEWLDKVNSRHASEERTTTKTEKEFHSYSESKESKRSDITKHESRTSKIKPAKQMYVAIVESHVYTNKDAILEDQVAEMSETASIQSSEEINAAQELFEATSTEKVAMSNYVQTEEKEQAVEIVTNALEEVLVQEKQEVLEAVSDFKSEIKEEHTKSVKQEQHTSFAAESTETVNEIKLETFETKETMSDTAVVSSEESYKATAQSTTEIILEASKEETTEFKVEEQQAVSKVESLAIAVAEATDVVVDDSKLETFESHETVTETAKIASEETYKTAAVEVTDVTFETAEEKHSERAKTTEVKVKEEAQHLAVAGIIETKTELCKELKKPVEDESASLKIVKYEIIDSGEPTEVLSESELNVQQSVEVELSLNTHSAESNYQSVSQESTTLQSSSLAQESLTTVEESSISVKSSFLAQDSLTSVQESSKSAKSSTLVQESSSIQESSITLAESSTSQEISSKKSLHLDTNVSQYQISNGDENNNTPTPTTVPPTPLTDEYVFKLEIPLPKNSGTVIIEDSPDREDPHIVKKGLVPHIETTIEEQIIYDPPLPTPPVSPQVTPVYTKPGLRGGAQPLFRREYIREIERKSSLLASAIDETIKSIEEYKEEVGIDTDVTLPLPKKRMTYDIKTSNNKLTNDTSDEVIDVTVPLPKRAAKDTNGVTNGCSENGDQNGDGTTEDVPPGFKSVVFNPEAYQAKLYDEVTRGSEPAPVELRPYLDAAGEPLGTVQGIVDGLEDAVVDDEVAKELGKPGITEDKIAVLISGESEMLREAHVMGLTRVLTSHMTRPSSVDFQKIKPLVPSLKDSEVIKLLNEELKKECEDKKKKESETGVKKMTTFLQKPARPVPRAKFGYPGYVEPEPQEIEEPYKVKIVKQPKPKVAPDYKPEDFETGPLPWEQRALNEPVPSPVPPEEPILIPEQAEFFEAVDPLPESEVPDLEDTGIPLPPTPPPEPVKNPPDPEPPEVEPEVEVREVTPEVEEQKPAEDMDQNKMAEQLVNTVKGMVDPNAPLEQQLCQMRAQLAALAQLPCVIQQSLEVLTRQLSSMSRQETHQSSYEAHMNVETRQEIHEATMPSIQEYQEKEMTQNGQEIENAPEVNQNIPENGEQKEEENSVTIVEVQEESASAEEVAALKREQDAMIEKQMKSEKERKERQERARIDQESRQVKQRAPRVGKPRPVFGPLTPEERPVVLPGGRRWRGPKDAYNDQFIAETLTSQSEIIQGKVMGYESDRLPYDSRINFMKYEKPPVSLDHLENSPTYKLIHNMEDTPLKRTDLLTPVVAEADYRERCRSATPMQAKALM